MKNFKSSLLKKKEVFETKDQPILPRKAFLARLTYHFLMGFSAILAALGIGMLGYHHYEQMSWIDAYVNAAMILSGMGPLGPPTSTAGKLFAGTYALFSGIIFLVIMGIIFAPLFHRFIHKFHLDNKSD